MGFFSTIGKIAGIAGAVTGQPWISALGTAASSIGNNEATQQAYNQNYELARAQLYNRHQIEVEDLKKAGLNPLLSVNSGASTFSPGSLGALSDLSSPSSARQAVKQSQVLDAQKENVEANTAKVMEEARNIAADTDIKLIDKDIQTFTRDFLQPLQKKSTEQLIAQSRSQTELFQSQVAVAKQTIRKIEQDVLNSIRLTDADVALKGAQANAADSQAGYFSAGAQKFQTESWQIQNLTPAQIDKLASERTRNLSDAGRLDAETERIYYDAQRISMANDVYSAGLDWRKDAEYSGFGAFRDYNPVSISIRP